MNYQLIGNNYLKINTNCFTGGAHLLTKAYRLLANNAHHLTKK